MSNCGACNAGGTGSTGSTGSSTCSTNSTTNSENPSIHRHRSTNSLAASQYYTNSSMNSSSSHSRQPSYSKLSSNFNQVSNHSSETSSVVLSSKNNSHNNNNGISSSQDQPHLETEQQNHLQPLTFTSTQSSLQTSHHHHLNIDTAIHSSSGRHNNQTLSAPSSRTSSRPSSRPSSRSHSRNRLKSKSSMGSKTPSSSSLHSKYLKHEKELEESPQKDYQIFRNAWFWRVIFIASILLRTYFALSYSYIHPDEHFQGPEAIADHYFGWATKKSWEFLSTAPARSYFVSWIVYGIPMFFIDMLFSTPQGSKENHNNLLNSVNSISPLTVLWGLRLTFTLGNWVLSDMALERLTKSRKHRRIGIFFYATSYVSWTYQSHTFSNSVETVVLLWCLVIIHEFETTREDKRYFFTTIWDSFLLGGLVAFGLFNRITFPAFLFIPGLRILPFFLTHPISFIATISSFTVISVIAVYFDTVCFALNDPNSPSFSQYPPLSVVAAAAAATGRLDPNQINWLKLRDIPTAIAATISGLRNLSSSKFIITPLNNLLYNLQTDNLALHGIHSRFHHVLVNIPELLGPVVILLFSLRYVKSIPFQSALSGIFLLSLVQHQEARFLLPAIPLLFCCLDFSIIPHNFRKTFFAIWVGFNVVMGVLMGAFHQGGIIPAQVYLSELTSQQQKLETAEWQNKTQSLCCPKVSDIFLTRETSPAQTNSELSESDGNADDDEKIYHISGVTNTDYIILWWKTYSPPIWMLGKPINSVDIIDPIESIPGGGENWARYRPILDFLDTLDEDKDNNDRIQYGEDNEDEEEIEGYGEDIDSSLITTTKSMASGGFEIVENATLNTQGHRQFSKNNNNNNNKKKSTGLTTLERVECSKCEHYQPEKTNQHITVVDMMGANKPLLGLVLQKLARGNTASNFHGGSQIDQYSKDTSTVIMETKTRTEGKKTKTKTTTTTRFGSLQLSGRSDLSDSVDDELSPPLIRHVKKVYLVAPIAAVKMASKVPYLNMMMMNDQEHVSNGLYDDDYEEKKKTKKTTNQNQEEEESEEPGTLFNNSYYEMKQVWSTKRHLSLDDIDFSNPDSLIPGLGVYELISKKTKKNKK